MASELDVGKRYIPDISEKELVEIREKTKAESIKLIADNIARMKKTDPNRVETMDYFDNLGDLFGQRVQEIEAQKEAGKKVVGYTCMFAPVELILAADAIPVRVGSGWYDPAKLGDRVVPVEVCPVIRSQIGAAMIGLSPFIELSDVIINPLSCDGRTKMSEIFADYKTVWSMTPPRVKDTEWGMAYWVEEVRQMKANLEELTGNKITRKNLRSAIETNQKASKAFRRLQEIRKGDPVIMGRDAMLVNQTTFWDDVPRWTEKTEELCDELEKRAEQKDWACPPDTPRVMVSGTPMIWPDNFKIPHIIEESSPPGLLAIDELCSGDRILFDPVGVDEWTMHDMFNAISERAILPCTCACFTSEDGNEDRLNWILDRIKEYRVAGVIYYTIRGCMLYAMEYMRVKRMLDSKDIPTYYLDTDYTAEDVGQMKTRVEAFMEMLEARVEFDIEI